MLSYMGGVRWPIGVTFSDFMASTWAVKLKLTKSMSNHTILIVKMHFWTDCLEVEDRVGSSLLCSLDHSVKPLWPRRWQSNHSYIMVGFISLFFQHFDIYARMLLSLLDHMRQRYLAKINFYWILDVFRNNFFVLNLSKICPPTKL